MFARARSQNGSWVKGGFAKSTCNACVVMTVDIDDWGDELRVFSNKARVNVSLIILMRFRHARFISGESHRLIPLDLYCIMSLMNNWARDGNGIDNVSICLLYMRHLTEYPIPFPFDDVTMR